MDCGPFQGYKRSRERNRTPFPVRPASIDAVVLTHAHLDHTGYVPALMRDGFAGAGVRHRRNHGPVQAAPPRQRLPAGGGSPVCHPPRIVHAQSGPSALHRGRRGEDSQQLQDPGFRRATGSRRGMELTFLPAGHILGAAQVHVRIGSRSVHFTGDLGRADDPLMYPPRPLVASDVLVTESTYGIRKHSTVDPEQQLRDIINRVAKRGGVVLFAAFAVGRAETLMLYLSRLRSKNLIPDIPVYLNSPMAIDASGMYQRHPEEHRLKEQEYMNMYKVAKLTRSVDESKLLNLRGGPMIIISASGMLTGGRVLHHLAAYGPDPKNAVILSGYQAGGTRGATLAAGERELRIYGEDVKVRAEVIQMESLSAHADADGIISWMRAAEKEPRMTYITHGEPDTSDALRIRIKRELGWRARVPEHLEQISIEEPR
ncbi:MBL fold metallo-hydrolase [Arthrobacter sp. AL12]|uniref:MBL fold metallo-hydrolase RNA specificity domain-containing protein n=1 Tax=Arthrobacter sp. AL12 TaxID=3042241 RepID=UPI00249B0E65|nr:MBL fold metallo-hydrolase [Arthrobacter sp. AL12]MDI3211091.1 MBL fold metallo-hydrolase [Arthrobacter sp. AL12]